MPVMEAAVLCLGRRFGSVARASGRLVGGNYTRTFEKHRKPNSRLRHDMTQVNICPGGEVILTDATAHGLCLQPVDAALTTSAAG